MKYITGVVLSNNKIIITENLLEYFKQEEHLALVIAMNIKELLEGKKILQDLIANEVETFYGTLLNKNINNFDGKFLEDFHLILNDIKHSKQKNVLKHILNNEFYYFYFNEEYKNFIKKMHKILHSHFQNKLLDSLDLMSRAGYNIQNLDGFNFSLIQTSKENLMGADDEQFKMTLSRIIQAKQSKLI